MNKNNTSFKNRSNKSAHIRNNTATEIYQVKGQGGSNTTGRVTIILQPQEKP